MDGVAGKYVRRYRAPWRLAAVVILAVLASACGTAASATPGGSVSAGSTAAEAATAAVSAGPAAMSEDDALRTYGYGPSPSPKVTFQPDVVVVGGGPASIRWAGEDGHTWAIDPNAAGAAQLKVGSVMLLTSRAVGRVVDLRDEGGSRIVTVGPVQLTELFSDANFDLSQPVDLGSMAYQAYPETPTSVTSLPPTASPDPGGALGGSQASPSPGAITMPAVRFASYRGNGSGAGGGSAAAAGPATAKQLPPASEACQEITLASKWSVKPCTTGSAISLGVDYNPGGFNGSSGLKFGGSIQLTTNAPKLSAKVAIAAGKLLSPTILIAGIDGINVNLAGGTANGAQDDGKFKLEIPIEVEEPIPPSPATLGIPMNLVLEFKMLIEIAMSGNNSTLSAGASYGLSGDMGVQNGQVVAPTLSVKKSILESLTGITLGPSGMVFAAKFKLHFGVGMEGFIAGPYATTTFSVGISKGSALSGSISNCQGAAIGLWVGGGAGVSLDLGEIGDLLPKLTKFQTEVEKLWNVYTVSKTVPDTKICQAGS